MTPQFEVLVQESVEAVDKVAKNTGDADSDYDKFLNPVQEQK